MNTMTKTDRILGLVALVAGVTACGGEGSDTTPGNGSQVQGCASVDSSTYRAFDPAHYANQIARVDAYEAIKKTRKSDSFSTADFGDLSATDPALTAPSGDDFASLYVETAGLAGKVVGRVDDHDYAMSYSVAAADALAGVFVDDMVRSAIAAGASADGVDKNATNGIGWYGQVVDKALQHFFYLSIYHEMVAGTRKNWDEAFGYYGRSTDGQDSRGVSATVASRDENCNLGLNDEIFAKLTEGACQLEAALLDAGADEVDPSDYSELMAVIKDIDLLLLTAFAISAAREFRDLPTSDKPAIKLIEGRMFFEILEPYMRANAPAAASFIRTEADKSDPTDVDVEGVVTRLTEAFGVEQTFASCN